MPRILSGFIIVDNRWKERRPVHSGKSAEATPKILFRCTIAVESFPVRRQTLSDIPAGVMAATLSIPIF